MLSLVLQKKSLYKPIFLKEALFVFYYSCLVGLGSITACVMKFWLTLFNTKNTIFLHCFYLKTKKLKQIYQMSKYKCRILPLAPP